MFQTGFPSIVRNTKLHIKRRAFVGPANSTKVRIQRQAFVKCLTLYVQFCAPDDGRKNRLKHVQRLQK